jgi:hypothetical protein
VRYTADGLYASKNYVVTHGGLVYVLSATYIDENSVTLKDFSEFIKSFQFIPIPGQE